MAPANPLTTVSLYVHYTSVGYGHEIEFRFPPGTDGEEAAGVANQICTAFAPLMRQNDSFDAARYRGAGARASFAQGWSAIPGTATNNLSEGDPEARFLSWVGREVNDGRRVRYTFFTGSAGVLVPDNNRLARGSEPKADDALDALMAATVAPGDGTYLVGIGGGSIFFNQYTNSGWNSHFQRKQRPR